MIFQDPTRPSTRAIPFATAWRVPSLVRLVPRGAEREAVEELLDQVGLVPAADFLRRTP